IVEQQEEGTGAADPVVGVAQVELSAVPALRLQLVEPRVGAPAELVERPELDRLRRAGLRACRLVAALQAVVAERALPDPAVLLLAEDRQEVGLVPHVLRRRDVALVEDAEGTRGHAVAAAVADVLLHDDRSELRAEERARRADVETRGVRA